ncbi:TetR/AcrR family transcriptional regulator C-terminal domain-containing protein [Pseudonocardia alni]|uniref:TetR/AcrR family transcriptional regulator C-terminal domain-containing protein n=1 Tax=Pseudonocardia alni TaxID=33907 RepID=UPI003410DA19
MSPKRADTGPPMPGAVWLRERPARRGDGGLTRERIAKEAVAQLDQLGESGLNLRGLARALGVHATTLYWHVAARDDLLDLALDEVFSEVAAPDHTGHDWIDDISGFMHRLRFALLRHPWSGALASTRPLLGPHALAQSELVYSALTRGGLAADVIPAAAAATSNLVIGSVAAEAAWRHDEEPAARRAVHEHLQHHADLYPSLLTHIPSAGDWETNFTHATGIFLAGLRRTSDQATSTHE